MTIVRVGFRQYNLIRRDENISVLSQDLEV